MRGLNISLRWRTIKTWLGVVTYVWKQAIKIAIVSFLWPAPKHFISYFKIRLLLLNSFIRLLKILFLFVHIFLNNIAIENADYTKCLSILFDKHCNWKVFMYQIDSFVCFRRIHANMLSYWRIIDMFHLHFQIRIKRVSWNLKVCEKINAMLFR